MAKIVMGQSYDHFSPALSPLEDDPEKTPERLTDRMAPLVPASAAARAMNGLSQEYFAFVQRQVHQGLNNINELSRCRTPQDLAALQVEILRQAIETVMESGRRIAEMSVEIAGAAAKQMQSPAA